MATKHATALVPHIDLCILNLRGQKVILDSDLARIYGVTTKVLNQAVKRNGDRFPDDFVFQLTREEVAHLRSQFATSSVQDIDRKSVTPNRSQIVTGSQKHRDRRFLPYAFTEHGAIMAAAVLNSPQAVQMSLFVVRAFVKMRDVLVGHRDLARKIEDLEKKYDGQFQMVFEAIRQLMTTPEKPRKRIGFGVRERHAFYRVRSNGNGKRI